MSSNIVLPCLNAPNCRCDSFSSSDKTPSYCCGSCQDSKTGCPRRIHCSPYSNVPPDTDNTNNNNNNINQPTSGAYSKGVINTSTSTSANLSPSTSGAGYYNNSNNYNSASGVPPNQPGVALCATCRCNPKCDSWNGKPYESCCRSCKSGEHHCTQRTHFFQGPAPSTTTSAHSTHTSNTHSTTSSSTHHHSSGSSDWKPAGCKNSSCHCDSWNGCEGEFCCRACRPPNSVICAFRQHIYTGPPPQPKKLCPRCKIHHCGQDEKFCYKCREFYGDLHSSSSSSNYHHNKNTNTNNNKVTGGSGIHVTGGGGHKLGTSSSSSPVGGLIPNMLPTTTHNNNMMSTPPTTGVSSTVNNPSSNNNNNKLLCVKCKIFPPEKNSKLCFGCGGALK